ncbi:NAD(P)/FAD-dependent oxidoreductase [Xanthobacter tagetidis]|uniref:Ferredoxin--NADP reductase n=1 Tax=Xanthobacter tagetidis TaxID=60216 RepID=A0A3L7A716_9HYPH|nr:NAD(P)/FAD-dependent oxidoreductase [Xanthobacter tagetidis]MBB6310048.1 thioredoxin reductase (NADPH) [Xanthobacter tagetidis]RLP75152.1 NAD(P)/FAD-dependent oxidoreductase [Xanthobacter tagetidis]
MSGSARAGAMRDVAVIGAGPVGLFTVFALGQAGLDALVVDALDAPGGQCAALYAEKPIYDIPGRPSVTAAALVADLVQQAAPYAPLYLLSRRAVGLRQDGEGFRIALSDGSEAAARAVVVAAGAGAFGPNRPPLPGLAAFEGESLFYAVDDPERFRGQRVVIAGGGDSAADWAVILAARAAEVTLVHRRPVFRAAPATLGEIERLQKAGRIRIAAPRTLAGLAGTGGRIAAVRLGDGAGGEEEVAADALLCFYGLSKDLSALAGFGIDAGASGIPVDPASMQTRRAGVFAVGDIADYPGKLKLILTGFAEAARAAHSALALLRPEAARHFEHSTSRGDPAARAVQGGDPAARAVQGGDPAARVHA